MALLLSGDVKVYGIATQKSRPGGRERPCQRQKQMPNLLTQNPNLLT